MWDIGNTTVRNAERIPGALRVFADSIAGRKWDKAAQEAYWQALKDAGVIESESTDERASLGRKFYSALRQLGFIHLAPDSTVSVTAVGDALLDSPELVESIFLRQLIKYTIPSPLEEQDLINLRPFYLLLRLLKEAEKAGLIGLTLDEVAAFVIPTLTDDEETIASAVSRIAAFREEYASKSGVVAKRQFAARTLERATPSRKRPGTLRDYADSSLRYARLSGLVTIEATGGRYVLSPSRREVIERLLADYPARPLFDSYLAELHDPEKPTLPTDDVTLAAAHVRALRKRLADVPESEALLDERELVEVTGNVEQQKVVHRLEATFRSLQEERFYREQATAQALTEVRQLLLDIKHRRLSASQAYAPAFLEWAIWRLFLAINEIASDISATRGFEVDEDMIPRGTARGGIPDLVFEYSDWVLVVEVTLTKSGRQEGAEGEPVRRHVAQVARDYPGKRVLCLFVAPEIALDTYNTFYNGVYFVSAEESVDTPVVALTIDDMVSLIDAMLARGEPIRNPDVKEVLTAILEIRSDFAHGPQWGASYPELFGTWISRVATGTT